MTRLGILLSLAAYRIVWSISAASERLHLPTDPSCVHHFPVKAGSRLDVASRGWSCTPCRSRTENDYWAWHYSQEEA